MQPHSDRQRRGWHLLHQEIPVFAFVAKRIARHMAKPTIGVEQAETMCAVHSMDTVGGSKIFPFKTKCVDLTFTPTATEH